MIEQVPKRFFCKLLKELEYVPCVIITDKLTSYRVVKLEIIPGIIDSTRESIIN